MQRKYLYVKQIRFSRIDFPPTGLYFSRDVHFSGGFTFYETDFRRFLLIIELEIILARDLLPRGN